MEFSSVFPFLFSARVCETFFFLSVLLVAATTLRAEDEAKPGDDYVRVLVFESGSKPAVADPSAQAA